MGRPPKDRSDEPRRVETGAKMVVADEAPVEREVAMKPAEAHVESTPERVVSLVRPAPEEPPQRPYYPMEQAPKDGTLLEATDKAGAEFQMVWRTTKRYNSANCRWEPVGFWSSHLSRQPLTVEPVGWRLNDGFITPGMIVT